ncbi:MAG: PQQ-binding-like beta-propeller repeat protein [Phycisphaerales bacterium]|nr:MAG: PQQ-binding-like beta-propeller repeat protein [Phycisphaerales bacterium]
MLTTKASRRQSLICILFCAALVAATLRAADQTQWGQRYTRNMISAETNLPEKFDPATGENIKWAIPLGSQAWATPAVANGKILIGTNNGKPRDPRHKGDRSVLWCLNESDGSFCWQLVVPKLASDRYLDWPRVGICSTPTVEGDRVYVPSNRCEILCLDLNGQANGNDGPFRDEGRHMVPPGSEPMQVTDIDADIIWLFDMRAEVGVHPMDETHSSILLHGPLLYANTSNGLDNKHSRVAAPEAPSLIVLDKATGRLVARDNENIGPKIFHCTWSSPALAQVNGQTQIIFCGGDAVCYGFKALQADPATETVRKLERIWRLDCDPTAPKEDVHKYVGNRQESPSTVMSMPVFDDGRVYVTYGGDIWWGKHEAWLACFDVGETGDITESGRLWTYRLGNHCCSTPSVYNGMVFVADCDGQVHCVDADTGKHYWTHQANGDIWGSTLVADGKVYVGTRRGHFYVFAADKNERVISSIELDDPINTSPVAANGVLYVATMRKLYAVAQAAK